MTLLFPIIDNFGDSFIYTGHSWRKDGNASGHGKFHRASLSHVTVDPSSAPLLQPPLTSALHCLWFLNPQTSRQLQRILVYIFVSQHHCLCVGCFSTHPSYGFLCLPQGGAAKPRSHSQFRHYCSVSLYSKGICCVFCGRQ